MDGRELVDFDDYVESTTGGVPLVSVKPNFSGIQLLTTTRVVFFNFCPFLSAVVLLCFFHLGPVYVPI